MNDHRQLPKPIRKSRFQLVGIEGSFQAFTRGDHWNGWDCPFFTRIEGQRLVEAWNSQLEGEDVSERGQARYDGTQNRFEFVLSGELDAFDAKVIDESELYPIGAYGWCWTECDDNLKVGDLVTYADPKDEAERSFIGTVIGHFPDADPPRTTVRWENSNMKIAPIFTHEPSAWVRLEERDKR